MAMTEGYRPHPEMMEKKPHESQIAPKLPDHDDGWDIDEEMLAQTGADTKITDDIVELSDTDIELIATSPLPKEKKKYTPRRKNTDGTRRTLEQQMAEIENDLQKNTAEALYKRGRSLEKKETFGSISKYEKMELDKIKKDKQARRDAQETQAIKAIIDNLEPTTTEMTQERPRQQILQRTAPAPKQNKSLFGEIKNTFTAVGNWFSGKSRIDNTMQRINTMSDEDVRTDVQRAATTEAAVRDAKAEAYATKLEAGPSTARKGVEAVGDVMTRSFDAVQDMMFKGRTVVAPEFEEEMPNQNATREMTEYQQKVADTQELWRMLVATQPKIKAINTGWFGPRPNFDGRPPAEFDARETGFNLSNADKMVIWLNKKGRTEEADLVDAYTDAFVEYQKSIAEITGVGNTGARGRDITGEARRDINNATRRAGNIRGF